MDDDDVVLVVATDHYQGSVDARTLGDRWTVRLAFGTDEATESLTDGVATVVLDAEADGLSQEDVVEAATRRDCRIVALTSRGDAPQWADVAVQRPLEAETFAEALATLDG